jgi:hypothetical protein
MAPRCGSDVARSFVSDYVGLCQGILRYLRDSMNRKWLYYRSFSLVISTSFSVHSYPSLTLLVHVPEIVQKKWASCGGIWLQNELYFSSSLRPPAVDIAPSYVSCKRQQEAGSHVCLWSTAFLIRKSLFVGGNETAERNCHHAALSTGFFSLCLDGVLARAGIAPRRRSSNNSIQVNYLF